MYSENLKKLRFELKLSARELAEKLGVSTGSIQNYEVSKREPNYNFMLLLCELLNVNLNWFVTGKGEMFNKTPNEELKNELRREFEELLKRRGL